MIAMCLEGATVVVLVVVDVVVLVERVRVAVVVKRVAFLMVVVALSIMAVLSRVRRILRVILLTV